MKARSGLVLLILLTLTAVNSFAQEITLTTNAANTVASKATINLPTLSNNPNAIIVATPLGNTQTLNPHPIGAWYYNNKWHIFNTNHATMPVGLTFKVEVFLNPDANQFLHVITNQNGEGYSFIDNPALNNNPTAQVRIFQNHAPDNRAFRLNPNEARVLYDAGVGKWYIQNVNLTALHANTAYNVVIASGVNRPAAARGNPNDLPKLSVTIPELTVKPVVNGTDPACKCSIDGTAGGDLGGTYPQPTVQKLLGRPLSGSAPTVGQLLRWNGTAWEPATVSGGGGTTFTPGLGLSLDGTTLSALNTTPIWNASRLAGRDILTTEPKPGQVLKWGGASWYPADASVAASPPPASTAAKPSVLYFNQSNGLLMQNPNVNSNPIAGLDNQVLTVPQSSRVVFHTVIEASTYGTFSQANATGVWLTVEILNTSNAMVARAVSYTWLTFDTRQTITSIGIGILPAGTYRTRVSINRQVGGAWLMVHMPSAVMGNQGGQMIAEIFPD